MKRTLLTIVLGALACLIANADESVITFLGGNYEGTSPAVDITDTTFAMDKAYDVPGVGTFTVSRGADATKDSQVKAGSAANPHLQFAINNTITLTPANVTITKVFFQCTTKTYTRKVSVSEGDVTVDRDGCTITWTGNATSALSVNNNVDGEPIRVRYIEITYSTNGSSAIEGVAADSNASVKYYNLNGTEVEAPVKGGVYVQVSGDEAHKIIAE